MEDLRNMHRHIEYELPSTMHLPVSSGDTLHFYWYLNTNILIAKGQFLLFMYVPIQNRAEQLQIYEVFSLPVPHSNLSAQYKIIHKYIGVTYDETKAVAIMYRQYIACQHANRQFCKINAPFQHVTNLPSCLTALYANNNEAIKEFLVNISCIMYLHTCCIYFKPLDHSLKPQDTRISNSSNCPDKVTSIVPLQHPFHILRLSSACSATSRYFHMPPHYEDHTILMNISLDTASLNAINISTLDFRIWQHSGPHLTCRNLQLFPKFLFHTYTNISLTLVNQFSHSQLKLMMKTHPSYAQS